MNNIYKTEDGDRISWISLSFKFIFLGFIFILLSHFTIFNSWTIHGLFCLVGLILSFIHIYRYKNRNISFLLIDHRIIFLLSFILYYLAGAALLSFGLEDEIYLRMIEFEIDPAMALRVDGINSLGFGIAILASVFIAKNFLINTIIILTKRLRNISLMKSIILISLISIPSKLAVYFFDVSNIYSEENLYGIIRSLGNLTIASFYLLQFYHGRNQKKLHLIGLILAIIFSILGIISFNKTDAILPLGVTAIAYAVRSNSKIKLLIAFIFIFIFFQFIGGPIAYSRVLISNQANVSILDRIKLIEDGIESYKIGDIRSDFNWWSRISYVNSQAAAINFYNNEDGGDDFYKILWVFVPRFLAPNKPIITSTGSDFYHKITGNYGSSTGQGIFANGYYNLGYFGVIFNAIVCGFIIGRTSALSRFIMESRSYILFPIIFLGILIAYRIDGTMIADYLGTFSIIIYVLMLLLAFSKIKLN